MAGISALSGCIYSSFQKLRCANPFLRSVLNSDAAAAGARVTGASAITKNDPFLLTKIDLP